MSYFAPCIVCGEATSSRTPRADGTPSKHQRCKLPDADRHGTRKVASTKGCRCGTCSDYIAAQREKYNAKCSVCGELTGIMKRDTRRSGAPVHNACKPTRHGTNHGYRVRGCRCAECRAFACSEVKAYAARFKERNGYGIRSLYPATEDQTSHWISGPARRAIYDLAGWTCQICGLDLTAEKRVNASGYPSLDHIVPRSRGGSDAIDNLQVLCRGCNSRKRDLTMAAMRSRGWIPSYLPEGDHQ